MHTMAPKSLFLKYLVPSLLGMGLMAINILIDGLFVSHGVGEMALAGVNIALPVYSIIFSISLWFGMGGATLYSMALGNNRRQDAKAVFTQTMAFTVLTAGSILAICLLFETQIAYLFGASDTIIGYVLDYLHIILLFGIIFVIENILSIFIRNDGNPTLAMLGLVVTALVNIVLNYVFIFVLDYGVEGAAYATIMGAVVGTGVLLLHFLRPTRTLGWVKTRLNVNTIKQILTIGFPSFVVEGAAVITIILFNVTFNRYAGDTGMASFAIVNYMHTVFLMLFIGVGAALQPITSFLYGAKSHARLLVFVKIATLTALGLGAVLALLGFTAGAWIVQLFGATDPKIVSYTQLGIGYFFLGYLFLGVNMVLLEFYQSIGNTLNAVLIVVLRAIVLFVPLLLILPGLLGQNSIWLVFPISEGGTLLLVYLALKFKWRTLLPHEGA